MEDFPTRYLRQSDVLIRQYRLARNAPVPANPFTALWIAFQIAYVKKIRFTAR